MVRNIIFSFIIFCADVIIATPHLILMGPPGSGKGTFSQYFVKEYGYTHICAGDIFRKEVRENTELGKKIKAIVDRGDYVDDSTAFEVMQFHICKALDVQAPFILDGYPRSKGALKLLSIFLQERGILQDCYVVHFVTDLDTIAERILSRVVCNNCQMVFNDRFFRSRMMDICDQCGHQLEKRTLDTQEVIAKRIKHYQTEILPLVVLAEKDYGYTVVTFDTNRPLQDCYDLYQALFVDLK